jgi:DNA-binding beta-propeller fold protein YncE
MCDRLSFFTVQWYKSYDAGGTVRSTLPVVAVLLVSALLSQAQTQTQASTQAQAATEAQSDKQVIHLPTSKVLSKPVPGRLGKTNSLPATIALSPDGHYAVFLNDGFGTQDTAGRQSIAVLDLETDQIADFPDDRFAQAAKQSLFQGLVFSSDGSKLYASVGSLDDPEGKEPGHTGNGIAVYSFDAGKVTPERFLKLAPQKLAAGKRVAFGLREGVPNGMAIPYPGGLAMARKGDKETLWIANNLADNVIAIDPETGTVLQSIDLSTSKLVPVSFPYSLVVTRDGKRAWCSLWNASRVAELDLAKGKVARWIPLMPPKIAIEPGSHPTAMVLTSDEKSLYVALANRDEVAEISTATGKQLRSFDAKFPGQKYAGSVPNALALSADGQLLFIADASINAVQFVDTSNGQAGKFSEGGFIPTEWYPTALATHGGDLLIATAKGQGTGPKNGPNHLPDTKYHDKHPYIPTLLNGSIQRVNIGDAMKNMSELTKQVAHDNLFDTDPGKITFAQGTNPIKHVIFILRENRTYDQIFGDIKVANGDPSLTMFGEDVTPNAHKLAMQFGVLDNFYDSGEVSGDGHVWTSAAITTDYNEKTWQIAYRSGQRSYDFGGNVADEFMMDHDAPDINDPETGFMWDNLAKNGRTYRDYGEFVAAIWCKPERVKNPKQGTPSDLTMPCPKATALKDEPLPGNVGAPHGSTSPYPWAIPLFGRVRPSKAALRDHYDPKYPDFGPDYPDQLRADEFLNEFAGFVRARNEHKGAELPSYVLLYLPDDHTGGTRPGKVKPRASVADNDIAVGRVVEAVSHSPYWDDTVITVVEDDAQAGQDHVDAHRSVALVISKYSPGSSVETHVEHNFYTTVNLVHTVESLLDLPPMNQNDAYAPVMAPMFTGTGNQAPFTVDYRNRDNGMMYETNPITAPGAKESTQMDFSKPDAADAAVLNAILWRDVKGEIPAPAPHHDVIPVPASGDE